MRILHVGNFGSRAKGAFLHGVAPKLSRGMVRLGHQVVDFDDRDIARTATGFGSRTLGVRAVNAQLEALAREMRPELLVLGHADTIRAETVARLRRAVPGLRVLQWNVDPLFEPDNVARIRGKIPVVDATLVSTAGPMLAALAHPGMRLGFLPNPVDFSVETGGAHLQEALPADLFFACGHPSRPRRAICGREWDMDAFVAMLRGAVPGLRTRLAGLGGQPHLAGFAYGEALRGAALGLNASRRNDALLYSSDRLAHMIGNGQAVLIERSTGYGQLFGEDEMVFFSSTEEIAEALRRLVREPRTRMAVAARGRERYGELFNERRVAGYLIDVALDRLDPATLPWPSLVC